MQLNGGQLSSFYRNVKVINDPILEPVHHMVFLNFNFCERNTQFLIYIFNC